MKKFVIAALALIGGAVVATLVHDRFIANP